MKVFVAGATGVLGRRALARLVEAGHEVTAVARSEEKAVVVRALGATPIAVDLFDADAVRAAAEGHDAVVNLATNIPPMRKVTMPGAWDQNNRIRTEASRNLADAAVATNASVFVQESVAFLYRGAGDEWIDEDTPIADTPYTESLRAAEASAAAFAESGGRGVVLRFGRFMAVESDQIAMVVNAARAGMFMEPGRSDTYIPLIHIDDAADAVVAALDAPAGVYHVVDDHPMTRGEHVRALAGAVGRRRLLRTPAFVGKLMGSRVQQLFRSQRTSNRRFKEATDWSPAYPDAHATYQALALELGVPKRLPAVVWISLALLAFTGLSVGVQALVDPRGFFSDFPMGRGWVQSDGPFNLHLLRDFAALNLGIGGLAMAALVGRSRVLTRAAGAVWLTYSVPHLVYHSLNRDLKGTDAFTNLAVLAVVVIAALVALAATIQIPVPIRPARRPVSASPGSQPSGNGGTSRRQTPSDRAATA